MRTESRSLVCFFLVACVPPWIGWSLLRFGVLPSDGAWQALYLTGWGASAAGLTSTYLEEGPSGVRRLLKAAVRFSVPLRWWLFALLVPVLVTAGSTLCYVAASGNVVGFEPSRFLVLVAPPMLITFFLGPFGEEFGWRGYLLPRFVKTLPALQAVILVGVIWAGWHWPLLYQGFVDAPGRELATIVAGITYMSLVIGTVYLRSNSLFLAMLMHWEINGVRDLSNQIFPGLPAGNDPLLQWCSVAASLGIAALATPTLLAAASVKQRSADRKTGSTTA